MATHCRLWIRALIVLLAAESMMVEDNSETHQGAVAEKVLHAAAGRLVLLHRPTYRLWLNPFQMLRRRWLGDAVGVVQQPAGARGCN
jgi:hypothetical protein